MGREGVIDLTELKTRHQKYRKTCTAIAMRVAAAIELGRQDTSLSGEIARPRQRLFKRDPMEKGILRKKLCPGGFGRRSSKQQLLRETLTEGRKLQE